MQSVIDLLMQSSTGGKTMGVYCGALSKQKFWATSVRACGRKATTLAAIALLAGPLPALAHHGTNRDLR